MTVNVSGLHLKHLNTITWVSSNGASDDSKLFLAATKWLFQHPLATLVYVHYGAHAEDEFLDEPEYELTLIYEEAPK